MHATFRRIRVQPGQVGEVARLIETEYLPLVRDIDGFVSYTLVDLGQDEVGSVGMFASPEGAGAANDAAAVWTEERLAPLVASPLELRSGAVLVTSG